MSLVAKVGAAENLPQQLPGNRADGRRAAQGVQVLREHGEMSGLVEDLRRGCHLRVHVLDLQGQIRRDVPGRELAPKQHREQARERRTNLGIQVSSRGPVLVD